MSFSRGRGSSSASGKASSPQGSRGTLLGFFKKVDGPTPPRTQGSSYNAPAAQPSKNESSSNKGTLLTRAAQRPLQKKKTPPSHAPQATETGLPSPPSSTSGRSVSPVASRFTTGTERAKKVDTTSGPKNKDSISPFKSPQQPASALAAAAAAPSGCGSSSRTANSRAVVGVNVRSGQPTPPLSSPATAQLLDEEDLDEEDIMPSSSRRAATKKRPAYFESGSEAGEDSDFQEDDAFSDASMSPVTPMRSRFTSTPAAKKPKAAAGPHSSTSTSSSREFSKSSAPAKARPPFARAHVSAGSDNRASPPEDGSTKPGGGSSEFSFLADRRDIDKNRPGDADFDPRTLYIPPSAWHDMSKFEKQYFEIKQWNMDTILMCQKGKFYEMFLEDAYTAHRELDLKLTDRGRMPMVGVPEASFDMFASKLLALGYKIGRVDQMETAVGLGMRKDKDKGKGTGADIVRRELRHVMTTGTMIEGLDDDLASYCVAISETVTEGDDGREVAEVGVCTLDAATSDFSLSEWADDQSRSELETLLRSLRVKEVIHKKGQLSKSTSRVIRNCVGPDCRITMLREDKEWLDIEGTNSQLEELFGKGNEALPEAIRRLLDRPEAMSALGGMFAYLVQLSLLGDVASSKNFNILDARRSAAGQPMKLDANTLSHLCILQNEDGSDTGTLHRLLNRCITPCGKRLFKIWLTHPLSEVKAIEERLNSVDDLLSNTDFEEAFARLRGFPDFERLIPKVHSGKIRPGEFTRLLSSFQRLTPEVESLRLVAENGKFQSAHLRGLLASIPDVGALASEIDSMFIAEEDGSFQPQVGVDEDFDDAQIHVEGVHGQLEDQLKQARKLLGLSANKKGGCNWKHKGTNEIYQIEVPKSKKVPREWLEISSTSECKGYYPPEVKSLVLSLKEARETRLAALKIFHARLFGLFNANADTYLKAVRALGEVDCLLSLAQTSYAMGEPTCRPTFVESERAIVAFEELRHPCIASSTDFIANDVKMGGDSAEVILLTGGNMAGKSTTARSTATGVILAQLGCRVPAKSAFLAPVDRICTRMGANDQMFKGSSTFMVEMQEASRILKDCTPRSLVIMDELGRGTSTFDGHAIAHAVLHHIIARTRCLSFFLTHYLQLAYDFEGYPRCANKHMEVLVDDARREVVFTYRLVKGVAESSYGTQVAGLAGVPREICDRASDISREFAEATKQHQAERTTSALPMSTLSDFAYLFRLGQGALPNIAPRAEDGFHDAHVASQLEVIRAQLQRISGGSKDSEKSLGLIDDDDVVMNSAGVTEEGECPVILKGDYPPRRQTSTEACPTSDQAPLTSPAKRSASYSGSNARYQRRRLVDGVFGIREDCADEGHIGNSAEKTSSSALRSQSSPVGRKKKQQDRLSMGHTSSPTSSSVSGTGSGEQLILDLGQKLQVSCRDCQMSYDRSAPEDVALHTQHHDRVMRGVEWTTKTLLRAGEVVAVGSLPEGSVLKALGKGVLATSARKENLMGPLAGGQRSSSGGGALDELDALLAASPSSKKTTTGATVPLRIMRYPLAGNLSAAAAAAAPNGSSQSDHLVSKKLEEVSHVIDEALGAAPLDKETRESGNAKMFLAIIAGRVVGAAVVGAVPPGSVRRVVDVKERDATRSHVDPNTSITVPTRDVDRGGDAIFLSCEPLSGDEASPILGVHRIYVLPSLRRQGIGRRLLDAVLNHSVYGQDARALLRQFGGRKGNVVAFSQPTEAGRRLAEGWLRGGKDSSADDDNDDEEEEEEGGGVGGSVKDAQDRGTGLLVFQEV